jgi:hypothetical protein
MNILIRFLPAMGEFKLWGRIIQFAEKYPGFMQKSLTFCMVAQLLTGIVLVWFHDFLFLLAYASLISLYRIDRQKLIRKNNGGNGNNNNDGEQDPGPTPTGDAVEKWVRDECQIVVSR